MCFFNFAKYLIAAKYVKKYMYDYVYWHHLNDDVWVGSYLSPHKTLKNLSQFAFPN